MYHRILLAYDGTLAGRRALREGANVAIKFDATTYLLAVMKRAAGAQIGYNYDTGALVEEEVTHYQATLDEGVALLKEWQLDAEGTMVRGDPVNEISRFADEIDADLVVVGHDYKGSSARWWHTSLSASLLDKLPCSLLIGMHGPATDEVINQ